MNNHLIVIIHYIYSVSYTHLRKEPARNPNPYPHNHDFFEMSYVYKGTFHNIIGGQQIDQPEDSLVLLSPQAKHRCFTRSSDDLVFNILIKRELIEKIFVQMLSESESVCRFFLDSLYNVRQKQPYLFFSCDNALTEPVSYTHLDVYKRQAKRCEQYAGRKKEDAKNETFPYTNKSLATALLTHKEA